MTKIDIFSGFLGAGKTTLIKKLIQEVYHGEKLVLIENEFGEIGVDGMFMQEAGIQVTEMNSGCICCSLVGDFGEAMKKVLEQFAPDRILVEPSGVGKLSDVIRAVQGIDSEEISLNSFTTVVDAKKCKMYMKNFGEFFNNQVEHANSIILSRTDGLSEEKVAQCIALLREHNATATIISTPWDQLNGKQILEAMEHRNTLEEELALLAREVEEESCPVCGGHHHHHDHEACECGHEHHHDHEACECGHEHHHDHEACECGHEHHHDHEACECGHEHHHDHHHADEVFTSWGTETAKVFTQAELAQALAALDDAEAYGAILRAKGAVASEGGQWLYFDYVPGETNIRPGAAAVIGRLCIIGAQIHEQKLKDLFGMV
ncbi:MAG: cobalamin biosynthesis protein CobW [Clostridiales bacterium]|nr:MAG: cobalamin biosynthesis protein CobW [Clostridiales bacterium]